MLPRGLRKSRLPQHFAILGILLLGAFACLSVDCASANAQALTWDPTGTLTVGSMGGSGTWNDNLGQWYNSSPGTQAWSPSTDAWFTGPAGTVTLTQPESVGNMTFTL